MLSPLPASKWDYEKAAHLLNRAGFGGTPSQIEELVQLGLEKSVASLVNFESEPEGEATPDWAKPDPTRLEKFRVMQQTEPEKRKELQREEQKKQRERLLELRHWWLERMVKGPRPLQEKLVLFWHGHFATSSQKVKDAYLMWRQNDIFRRNASGSWLTLLTEVGKDPAMLLWLDQAQSRRDHPNENFAREVMELFALGEGHYTEKDITEAARSLTGWSYDRVRQEFVYRPNIHDNGLKTVFGRTGRFTGYDVLRLITEQPQAARFITSKLWTFFAATEPSQELASELEGLFRKSGMQFKPLLQAMFTCEEFYSDKVIRQQVKSPVQWMVSSVRMLERELPPPMVTANALRMLGQDLFLPPNVKGWDGGLSWITTNNLLTRYNFAGFLVLGENPFAGGMAGGKGSGAKPRMNPRLLNRAMARGKAVDASKLLPPETRQEKESMVAALEKRFLQGKLRPAQRQTLQEYFDKHPEKNDHVLLHAVRLIMSTPEYQLT
jgi:uncharacterized protein (DUF1800 family)